MSYDRVAYSDKRPFSASSEEYSDDPYYRSGKHANGNGVYNDYTVEVPPKTMKPLKFLCCSCKNTKRSKYIMITALLVLFISIILVVVSAIAHVRGNSENSDKPERLYGRYIY